MSFEKTVSYLEQTIEDRLIPGAVLRVERGGDLLFEKALGLRHTAPERRMEVDTLFDVASLTKVTATLGVVLTLFEKGTIHPNQQLGDFLPIREDKKRLTIGQCLSHSAGFPSSIDLRQSVMEINDVDLAYEPGTQVIYSDIGFLLLGHLIEVVTGTPLNVAVRECTTQWGMTDTGYNPTDAERCAATEWREYLGRYQLGEVHDENATTLRGVAGHAGLFSTAKDLAKYGSLYLSDQAGDWFLRSRECLTEGLNDRRGLGWLLWKQGCFGGTRASADAFGHTGFTGTSLWMDPALNLVIVLLTNRVHYGRHPHILKIREDVHTLVYEALLDSL